MDIQHRKASTNAKCSLLQEYNNTPSVFTDCIKFSNDYSKWRYFLSASSIFLMQTESEHWWWIQIDKNGQNFHLLFLEDDVGQKWIKIDKSRRVLWVLRSNVSAAKRKHDKMQSQNGIRIPTYVAYGFGHKPKIQSFTNKLMLIFLKSVKK